MNQKLTEGNISKTKPPVLEVIKYLKELKEAWVVVEEKVSKGNVDSNANKPSNKNENNEINKESKEKSEIKLNIKG